MKLFHVVLFLSVALVSCKNSNSQTSKNSENAEANNIRYSKEDFSKKSTKELVFSESFTLKQDPYLSIQFTLEEPLVKSLQVLAPSLSETELLNSGNFQFTFLVDGEIVYVENLNTGAGLAPSKTERLTHNIRLAAPQQLDYWGWFLWLKFMKLGGGQDVLNEGEHALSIEVRPYVQTDSLKTGDLLAKGDVKVMVPKIEIDEKLVPLQQIQPNSGWEISKEKIDTKKIEALNRKIAEQRFEHINGIVVIKEGQLLLEEYFNGADRNSLHNPRSVGKTIASTMLGVAIEENYISNEQTVLKEYYDLKTFDNYSSKKEAVTLKSLLTMSSGFLGNDDDYESPGNEENMYPTGDWVKFALDLPMDNEKTMEKDFSYFTAGVVVLGDIIHKAVPGGLVDYADKKIFQPLGITDYRWQYTPQKVGNTAGGLQLRAVDFAKYGQLYKNKGLWNGKQLVSTEWVEKSLAKQLEQSSGYYGYLFWNKTYTIDGTAYEVSYCSGNGGNKIFVFKDIPFVIVVTASAYGSPTAHPNVDRIMTDYVLPAVLGAK
ncbi:beta-lactamase family protein [Maribacter sp.]|nr:beta-lactamase family protein [Maribacter sp.]